MGVVVAGVCVGSGVWVVVVVVVGGAQRFQFTTYNPPIFMAQWAFGRGGVVVRKR